MVIEIMQREIATRGIGYIVLRDCPEDRLGEALGKGMEKLKKSGARQVWATSLPEGEPLHPGPVGVWRLTPVYTLLQMEKPLSEPVKAEGGLTIRPVKKATEEKLYLELVNKAQGDIPGFRLLGPGDLKLPNHRRAMAWQGDQPVGAYDLDLSERVPELVTLAVAPDFRRQGLGRAMLRSALGSLGKAPACALTVPSTAEAALALLQAEGFAQTGVASDWFEVV